MPQIPGELDYGARKSERSNRLDMPGQGEMAIVDSLANAAGAFTDAMVKHKEKNDGLAYSKAKSDLLSADIRIRRELNEAGDWENYQDDYRTRMSEALDGIAPTITDPSDSELFSADANLTTERGVTAMSEVQRARRQEHELALTIDMLDDRRREMLSDELDNETRIDLLLTTQDYIRDQVKAGNLAADAGEREIKRFIADVSRAQVMTLPLRTRAAVLEAAIAANVDPEAEDFKPSGSLADFMHQDERIDLLAKTEKLIESEETLGNAQAKHDEVVNLYKAETAANFRARREAVIADKNLTPEERQTALDLINNTEVVSRRIRGDEQDEILKQYRSKIRIGLRGDDPDDPRSRVPFTTSMIPRDQWNVLSAGQQAALTAYADNMQQGRAFALTTQMTRYDDPEGGIEINGQRIDEMPSWSLWRRLTNEQKAGVDLDSAAWLTAFREDDWRMLTNEQELINQGRAPDMKDLATNNQLVRDALISTGWVPATDRDIEEDKTYARVILELNRLVFREQTQPGMDKQLGYPDYGTRLKILNDLMSRQSYTDGGFFDRRDPDPDEIMAFHNMSDAQKEAGWLPLTGGPAGMNAEDRQIALGNGDYLNAKEYLTSWAMNPVDDPTLPGLGMTKPPDDDDLQRAWFAYFNEMDASEVLRRLEGK